MLRTAIDLYDKHEAEIKHAKILIESEVTEDLIDEVMMTPFIDAHDSETDVDPDALDIGLDYLDNDIEAQIELLMDIDYDNDDQEYTIDELLEVQSMI